MNAELEHLVVLQAQDLELTRLRAELAEGPRRVAAADKSLKLADEGLAAVRGELATEEKLRRSQELEAAAQRSKLDRLRRSLDGAVSAQQVNSFEHEISFAQAAILTLEDEELASMERTEAAEASEKGKATAAERERAALASEREATATQRTQHAATILGVERERTGLRAQIAPSVLASYDRLAKTRGTAIAEAIGSATAGKCAACQMGVRPQRWQDLIGRDHTDEIFACESCGRMLFWDPRRDTPRPWAAGERLQAAQAGKVAAQADKTGSMGGPQ